MHIIWKLFLLHMHQELLNRSNEYRTRQESSILEINMWMVQWMHIAWVPANMKKGFWMYKEKTPRRFWRPAERKMGAVAEKTKGRSMNQSDGMRWS